MARPLSVFVNIGAKIAPSLGAAARATERRFEQMAHRMRVVGAEMKLANKNALGAIGSAAGFGYAASRAVRPFVEFEDSLARLGNTAEVHGARLDAIGRRIVATGAAFGMGGRQALVGAQDFVAAGLSLDTAMQAMAPTLKLAKTAGVEIGEASQSGIALMQNLGVEARQLGAAFDIMAKAGKEGRFEINDMAKAFPGVASRAGVLGMSGLDGVRRMSAMLQITRMNARDADEASNNLLNFLDKLTSGETQKRFAKMGVSVEGVFAKSKANGKDFVAAMLDEIGRLTNGGRDGFALSALFEDRQARMGALALLQNRAELSRIYGATGNAGGTLNRDFANIAGTSKFGLDRFAAGIERVGIALGRAFGPMLGDAAMRLADMAEAFAAFAEKHPAVIRGVGLLIGGIVGLRAAAAAGRWALSGLIDNVLRIGGVVGRILPRLVPLRVAMVGARYGIAAALAVSGPFAAVLGAIGVGIAFIIAKWEGIRAFFSGFAESLSSAISPEAREGFASFGRAAMAVLSPLGALLGAVAGWLGKIFGPADVERWRSWGSAAGEAVGWVVDALGRLIRWLGGAMTAVSNFFSSVGNFLSGGGFTPKPAGARAHGGSVSAGHPYLVGERGPEMMVPGRSGTVIPAHAVAAMNRGVTGGNVYNLNVNIDGSRDPQATVRALDAYMRRLASRQAALLSD